MDAYCECVYWARTDARSSRHHTNCPHFKEERFVRISMEGGATYLQPEADLRPLLDEIKEAGKGQKWTLELVLLTQDEYERLPEFTGH